MTAASTSRHLTLYMRCALVCTAISQLYAKLVPILLACLARGCNEGEGKKMNQTGEWRRAWCRCINLDSLLWYLHLFTVAKADEPGDHCEDSASMPHVNSRNRKRSWESAVRATSSLLGILSRSRASCIVRSEEKECFVSFPIQHTSDLVNNFRLLLVGSDASFDGHVTSVGRYSPAD